MSYITRTDKGSIINVTDNLDEAIQAAQAYQAQGFGDCEVEKKIVVFSTNADINFAAFQKQFLQDVEFPPGVHFNPSNK